LTVGTSALYRLLRMPIVTRRAKSILSMCSEKALHEVLTRLLAIGNNIDPGGRLLLQRHQRRVALSLDEVAVSRQMFQEIMSLIARLRAPPAPA
jgi:hypothetical protein